MNTTTERFSRRLGEKVRGADYASPIERFGRRRMADAAFAFCLAVVVLLVCAIGAKGWIFGAMQ